MIKNILTTIKQRQYFNLLLVMLVTGAIIGIIYAITSKHLPVVKKENTPTEALNFAGPLQKIDAESILLDKTQLRLAEAQKKTDLLQQHITALEKERQLQSQQEEQRQHEYEALKDKINRLEIKTPETINNEKATNNFPLFDRGIKDDQLSLKPLSHDLPPEKNPDTYIPAGTFVKAVLIGGADVSAAVNSQSNPTPILLKIVADGTLPNQAHSHLKGCVATAAAIGDISSERGMIRLETLSCVHKNQAIVDIPVEGTVFGPEGKNGVRGLPLWREGALLQRAFTAGALSGLTNGLQQKYTTTAISPLGKIRTITKGEIFKYGATKGTSNAMDKLAKYEIQRAEQYHPVIQVSAGTFVDIVFLKGFFLDKVPTEKLKHPFSPFKKPSFINDPIPMSSLPLTPSQIERLKAHDTELRKL